MGEDKIEVGVKVPSWCRDTASSPETLDLPISTVIDGESPLGPVWSKASKWEEGTCMGRRQLRTVCRNQAL